MNKAKIIDLVKDEVQRELYINAKDNVFVFSCPICGHSTVARKVAQEGFYEVQCLNCGCIFEKLTAWKKVFN